MNAYILNITVHVLAAFVWVGGTFFFAIVAAPVLRRIEPPELRASLFQRFGEAFRITGWIAIAILLATGLINLRLHGWLGPAVRGEAQFWTSMAGRMFAIKFMFVALMLLLSALHDFRIGPLASAAEPGSPQHMRHRRTASWIARANAIVGVALVYVSIRLARGF